MKYLILILLLQLSFLSFSQDSFASILKTGKGEVVLKYRNIDQFIISTDNGQFSGLEYEISQEFFKWVEKTYQVELNVTYSKIESFNQIYNDIKTGESGEFAMCSFSITADRLKEVHFSPGYFSDIDVLISSRNMPLLNTESEFPKVFSNSTAVSVEGTTFDRDIDSLLSHFDMEVDIKYVYSSDTVVNRVLNFDNCFAYVELASYFKYLNKGIDLNRQNFFFVQREGYGMLYPLESDWHYVVWEFFSKQENKDIIKDLTIKYFGLEMMNFIDKLKTIDDEEKSIMLLNKEKGMEVLKAEENEVKYQNEKLDNKKNQEEDKELRTYLIIGVIILGFVIVQIFISLYRKSKENKLITAQKEEVEAQKQIIEEKHKLITDSIRYAKRIQSAMLQEQDRVDETFPDNFIFFQPKDIVSGDFYWGKILKDQDTRYCYFAAVDCTGHGVPGGFMSMLGVTLLNDILFDKELITPAEILEVLRDRVISELHQKEEVGSSRDGMDISLCRVNLDTLELVWSGAYNPLYICRKGELISFKANKQPIGYYDYAKPFDNVSYQLEKGDMVYSATDGIPDQFGGPRDKKLKSSGFKKLLLEASLLSTKEQKKYIDKYFNDWKGNNEQIDDVCVIAIRI